ncbi:MAG: GHKL domain-containing protein [Muricomes sp.]
MQLSKADEERRKLLHDVNHYIRTAANCIAMENTQGAKEIFEKLNVKIQETKSIEYSKSKILNIIMTDRSQNFAKEGIAFSVKIEPDIDFAFMDETDLIAILGNLLDNAFEAAAFCGKDGFINVRIFTENQGHFLIINVDNNYAAEPVLGEKGYLTIKRDKENHGVGIHTVEQIVKRYRGNVSIDIKREHKIFSVTIIFQL